MLASIFYDICYMIWLYGMMYGKCYEEHGIVCTAYTVYIQDMQYTCTQAVQYFQQELSEAGVHRESTYSLTEPQLMAHHITVFSLSMIMMRILCISLVLSYVFLLFRDMYFSHSEMCISLILSLTEPQLMAHHITVFSLSMIMMRIFSILMTKIIIFFLKMEVVVCSQFSSQ